MGLGPYWVMHPGVSGMAGFSMSAKITMVRINNPIYKILFDVHFTEENEKKLK